ncbi:hypothetical protein [Nostoc sp. LEGE 12450]|uniref:hypothetical protein n=1 Tax=Nostoc sp. LEGE 12450 TaxID=1828643 RepID=UPI00187F55D9|nr:hypothetical protein [Nostoc sp. LEGE 12450]MBE8989037.1 hypothetical protein [Nostoc sp. LEGE 12450]
MSDKTWKTQELLDICSQNLTDEAAVYVASVRSKIDRILFIKDRFTTSVNQPLKISSSEFSKTQIEVEIYIESLASNLHSLTDVLGQIINVIILKPLLPSEKHLSSETLTIKKVKKKLTELTLDSVKRTYADEIIHAINNLDNSDEFSYISGFVNTIKHRRLLNTTFYLKKDNRSLIDLGFKLDEFEYNGNSFPQKWCKTIVIQDSEKIIDLIFDIGNSINNFCRAIFIMNV